MRCGRVHIYARACVLQLGFPYYWRTCVSSADEAEEVKSVICSAMTSCTCAPAAGSHSAIPNVRRTRACMNTEMNTDTHGFAVI
jgi:hypothetical protein